MMKMLEILAFRLRPAVLGALLPLSLIALWIVLGPVPAASPTRFLPLEHPYVATLSETDGGLPATRVVLLLEARQGSVWTDAMLRRLKVLADDVAALPGVAPLSVRSLWSPDIRYLNVTDDGIAPVSLLEVPARKNAAIPDAVLTQLPSRAISAGAVGHLVSADGRYLMVSANVLALDLVTGARSDPDLIATTIAADLVPRYSDQLSALHVVSPLPPANDLPKREMQAIYLFIVSLFAAALLVPLFMVSFAPGCMATLALLLPVLLSQSLLRLSHFPFDTASFAAPYAILALGLGQAVRVLVAYEEGLLADLSSAEAARQAMLKILPSGLLIFAVALLALATLYLIPVPFLRETAESATLTTLFMVLSCFILLPLLLSLLPTRKRQLPQWLGARATASFLALGKAAAPRNGLVIIALAVPLFLLAAFYAGHRQLATEPSAMAPTSDANLLVTSNFPATLNELTLIIHTPEDACLSYRKMKYLDDFAETLRRTPGLREVQDLPARVKFSASGWNEGNLKWHDLPRNRETLAQAISTVPGISRLMNADCTRLAYRLYLQDTSAPTIATAVAAVKNYGAEKPFSGIRFELAAGPLALAAATNETMVHAETAILGWISLALVAFLVLVWRDWRTATLCLIPLIYATGLGYGLMGVLDLALSMPLLPVMSLALAVGMGLILPPCMAIRAHLAEGRNITDSCRLALGEAGLPLAVGALAPAFGTLIWCLSPEPAMAASGLLFAVMLLCEALAILVFMPALAAGLELVFPRRPAFIRRKAP